MTGYDHLGPVAGGGGAVRARRRSDGAEVVVKRLSGAGSQGWLDEVARRSSILARIQHPALPRILEVVPDGAELVVVMEYAAAGSLADRLSGGRTLPPGVVAELFATLGEGLEVAHRAGLLHLDLKPSNILYRADGSPFLSDFGHDRLLETSGQPTPGAAEYLDPAVARGAPLDAAADVYALAALSYEALTGSPPYAGENVVEVSDARRRGGLRPMAQVAPALPAGLAEAVERALDARRDRRFGSAGAYAAALLPGGTSGATPAPDLPLLPAPPAPIDPPPRRTPGPQPLGRWPVGAALLAATILVAALVATPGLLHAVGLRGPAATHLVVAPDSGPAGPPATSPAVPIVDPTIALTPGPPRTPPPPRPVVAAPRVKVVTPLPTPSPTPPKAPPVVAPAAAPPPGPAPPSPIPPPLPPKGQRIAFTGTGSGKAAIYVTNPVGGILIRLTNSPAGEDSQPAWSPDGSRIAFTSTRDGSRQIYLMNADGTNQHRMTTGTANNYDPAWDPTGASIAYTSEVNGRPQIFTMGAAGGAGAYAGPTPPSSYTSPFFQPAWSPDGRTLLATVGAGATVIESWNIPGGAPTVLAPPPIPAAQQASWSPDGARIVSSNGVTRPQAQIWFMAADGTKSALPVVMAGDNQEPHFSPAGNRIIFVTDRAGLRQVWTMDLDGSHQAPLIPAIGETYDPSWG